MRATDEPDFDRLQNALPAIIVRAFEELPSTNDWALEYCRREQVEVPILVVAKSQTSGRGRGANRWISIRGSLTFSLIYSLDSDSGNQLANSGLVALATAVGLCKSIDQAMASLGVEEDTAIKWPNDLMLQNKKLGGVLIETVSQGPGSGMCMVIGCGINVNNRFDAATQKELNAVSLHDVAGTTLDWTAFLCSCVGKIDLAIKQVQSDPAPIVEFCRRADWLLGKAISIQDGRQGIAAGINENGHLMVEVDGELQAVSSGSVEVCD